MRLTPSKPSIDGLQSETRKWAGAHQTLLEQSQTPGITDSSLKAALRTFRRVPPNPGATMG